jgi:hypothetical protein
LETTLRQYIDTLNQIYSTGVTTEHSFRGAFASLCENILNNASDNDELYTIINEPSRKDYGAPDYEIIKGDTAIGFIEAKNIGDTDLRGKRLTGNKKQFDRYKNAVSLIAFTDYLNIILYINGEEALSSCIGIVDGSQIVYNNDPEQISIFIKIILKLGNSSPQPIRSAKILADKMAQKAKLIANILHNAMSIDPQKQTVDDKDLWGKLNTFKQYLVHDMTDKQFVDFYAQTVLYGLFVARIYDPTPESFSLTEAADLIPGSNPFLRRIFRDLALAHPHQFVKGILEDLVILFKVTDMNKVLRIYRKDPLVHFYEDFLEAYNPKIREDYGVWYTPVEVVKFIVDSVDSILKDDFNIIGGIANNDKLENGKHKVQILDPATGTGTFLAAAAEKIYESYRGQEGLWGDDVIHNIIPRLNGFEYLVAPYTMAHLKLATALKIEDIPDRLNIFLTNSLEEDHPETQFEFARYITDESNAASIIKRETPIMVIMGNPPYNEKSANTGKWIMDLMADYKQEPGMARIEKRTKRGLIKYKNTLDEKNAKGINNDYCKFIRLGHNFVTRNQDGVLAYICGNTFTKTNIFRGMRYRLLEDFDEIYILNLHGSSKFDESSQDIDDENIFNIMVGVSINIFVKRKDSQHTGMATVHYKDVFGTRRQKLDFLSSHQLQDIDFETISPESPFYEFCPKAENHDELKDEYESGFKFDSLMPKKVQGFTTDKDSIAICNGQSQLTTLINDMVSDDSNETLIQKYGFKDTRDWKLSQARNSLRTNRNRARYLSQVCYRPFDVKWTYLHRDIVTYPRPLIQSSMLGKKNVILCVGKQGTAIGNNEWSLVWISSLPTDKNVNPRGGAYLFPLFIFEEGYANPTFNFAYDIIEKFEEKIGLKLQSEDSERSENGGFLGRDVIDYIYAVLHSSKYRRKYHQFLQNDFPVIPYPNSAEYFFKMSTLGAQLRSLHLLEDISSSDFITQYPISEGSNLVTTRRYEAIDSHNGRVWINDTRYFDNVPLKAWKLFVSGYQPLDKWLKDRMGLTLSGDDIRHFQMMVVALTKTAELMAQIDEYISV